MTTGERIKYRRKQLGISADELALQIGVSRSTVFRYENGDIEKLPANTLIPIADFLRTTVEYLMGWTDNPEEPPLSNKKRPTPEGEPTEDLLVLHRNGKRIEYHLTPQQLAALKPLLDQLDSNSDSDI